MRAYIAHPIGGDPKGNIERITSIIKDILYKEPRWVVPIAPYYMALAVLDDERPVERKLGMEFNREYFKQRMIDELWICSERVSPGMRQEIEWANQFEIPVLEKTQYWRPL